MFTKKNSRNFVNFSLFCKYLLKIHFFTHFFEFVQTLLHFPLCRICTLPAKILGPSTNRISGNEFTLEEASWDVVNVILS